MNSTNIRPTHKQMIAEKFYRDHAKYSNNALVAIDCLFSVVCVVVTYPPRK